MRPLVPLLSAMIALCACNTPTAYFRGIDPVRVTVGGSSFDIRRRDDLAEAIRVNPEYAPRLGPVGPRAAHAMARATGCEVIRVTGDQAVMLGRLDCPD